MHFPKHEQDSDEMRFMAPRMHALPSSDYAVSV
jgi:hypothetical protein